MQIAVNISLRRRLLCSELQFFLTVELPGQPAPTLEAIILTDGKAVSKVLVQHDGFGTSEAVRQEWLRTMANALMPGALPPASEVQVFEPNLYSYLTTICAEVVAEIVTASVARVRWQGAEIHSNTRKVKTL